jgi:TPR repeat protein
VTPRRARRRVRILAAAAVAATLAGAAGAAPPLPPAAKPVPPRTTAPNAATPNAATPNATVPNAAAARPASAGEPVTAAVAYASYQRGLYITAFAQGVEAAAAGEAAAMTLVGSLYANGAGVPRSMARASEWYSLASLHGDANGMVALAEILAEATDATRDRAAELIRRAADLGSPEARFRLGIGLLDGPNRAADLSTAARLIAAAAGAGNRDAQYAYALLLAGDELGRPDPTGAARWMGEAARAGYTDAEIEFAIMLANGRGVGRDIDAARRFLTRAAYKGNPIAQNRLARLNAAGLGGPIDLVEAARWHLTAKAAGLNDANLDLLVAGLTPAERLKVDLRLHAGLAPTDLPPRRFEIGDPALPRNDALGVFVPLPPGADITRSPTL